MITKTIGSGGDYPTILDGWIDIAPAWPSPALLDDYTFHVISDFTEKNITAIQNTYRINLNGKSLSIVNPGGYRITVPNLVTYSFVSEGTLNGGSISWQNLIHVLPYDYGASASLFNFIGASVLHTVEYKNMIVLGGGVTAGVSTNIFGISDQAASGWGPQVVKMCNCKISGAGTAVKVSVSSNSLSSRTDIENCSIYGCNYGFNLQQRSSGATRFYIKNCVAAVSTTAFTMNPVLNNPDKISISNCADSDNSIASSGATLSGNITGITDLDFISVDPASANFLKIGKKREYQETVVGWWRGEDNPNDSVGSNTAQWVGTPQYVAGYSGKCFKINDVGRIEIPIIESYGITPTGSFSVEFYSLSSVNIFLWHIFGNTSWKILVGAPEFPFVGIVINDSDEHMFPVELLNDVWYKIKVLYNNGEWIIYVDDTLAGAISSAPISASGETIFVSSNSESGINIVLFDEIKIGTNVLAPSTVNSALYKTGTTNISAWNTEDAWGNARPDIFGDVSIGVYEPVLTWTKGTMKFIAGSTEITVTLPGYGYESEVVMPITTTEKHPSGYGLFDRDSTGASDYRVLSTATWQLPIAQKSALNVFFRSAQLGRCENVTMRLGPDASGFFPFGPDKGDKGDFTVRIISQNQGGMLFSPWRYFRDDLAFVLVSAPAYSLPTQVDQGSLEIGTVDGLLFPQNGFSPKIKHNFRTELSRTGIPHSIDGNESGDGYETEFDQQCNQSKAAALVAFLTGATGRATAITINAQDYYYMFGFDKGSSGLYSTQFLGSERRGRSIVIKVRHEKYNQFTIPLSFWFEAMAGTTYQDTDAAATIWQDTDGVETILQDSDK